MVKTLKTSTEEFSVKDLDGIGEVKAKKLIESGVSTPYDIIIRGAEELSQLIDEDRDSCSRLVEKVKEQLRSEGKFPPRDMKLLSAYKKNILRLKTGSLELDNMLGGKDRMGKQIDGGIETQAVTQFYAEEGAGKTQLALTLTAKTLEAGHAVLFIDCENTFEEERFMEICETRGITPDLDKLLLESATDSDTVMHIVDGSTKLILDHNIKLIMIDGALGLFRYEYQQGRADLNSRQNKLKPFFLHLKRMAEYLNIAVVVTNQVMDNPDPYSIDKIKQVGGHIAGHAPKYILWFKKNSKNKRTVTFKKSNRHAMYDIVIYLGKSGIQDNEKD